MSKKERISSPTGIGERLRAIVRDQPTEKELRDRAAKAKKAAKSAQREFVSYVEEGVREFADVLRPKGVAHDWTFVNLESEFRKERAITPQVWIFREFLKYGATQTQGEKNLLERRSLSHIRDQRPGGLALAAMYDDGSLTIVQHRGQSCYMDVDSPDMIFPDWWLRDDAISTAADANKLKTVFEQDLENAVRKYTMPRI